MLRYTSLIHTRNPCISLHLPAGSVSQTFPMEEEYPEQEDLLSSFTTAVGREVQSSPTFGESQYLGGSSSSSPLPFPPSVITDADGFLSAAFLPPNSPTPSPRGTPHSSPMRPMSRKTSPPSSMRKVSPGMGVHPLSLSTTSDTSDRSDRSDISHQHKTEQLADEFNFDSDDSMSPGTPTHVKHHHHQHHHQQQQNQSSPEDSTHNFMAVNDLLAQTDSLLVDTGDMLSSKNNTTIRKYTPTNGQEQEQILNMEVAPDRISNNAISPGLLGEADDQPGMSDSMLFPSKPATTHILRMSGILDQEDDEEDNRKEEEDAVGALPVSSGGNGNTSAGGAAHPLGMSVVMTNAALSEHDPSSDISIVHGDASRFLFASNDTPNSSHVSSSMSPTASSPTSLYDNDTSVTMKIRLRQDVPSAIVHDILTTVLLSKGMIVVLKSVDTLRAESKTTGRTVTSTSGVVRESKHRVVCISVHGCSSAPYVDLGNLRGGGSGGSSGGASGGNGGYGRQSRGSSFTEVLSSTAGSVSGLLLGSTPDSLLDSTLTGSNGVSVPIRGVDVPLEDSALDNFTRSLYESLRITFQHQGLTLSAMMQHRAYADFSRSNNTTATSSTTHRGRSDDILIATAYLRQLRDAYRRDMVRELTSYAEPLDKYVHEAEWTCAQFISAMRFVFQKYQIPMPHMPRAPRLTDVVLTTPSSNALPKPWELTTIYGSTSPTAEGSDKNKYQNQHQNQIADTTGTTSMSTSRCQHILQADKTAHERFARECRVESEMRMQRKQKHVQDRVHRCQTFKTMIIRLLRESTAAASSSWSVKYRNLFSSNTNTSNRQEVVLYTASAMLGSRLGNLWLTYDHVCFYSSILGFTKHKVWSMKDINAVWKQDGK